MQAGLNLNLAAAVSGLFSSKSKKTTNADGSSVEEKEEQAAGKGESDFFSFFATSLSPWIALRANRYSSGKGVGNLQADAAAAAEENGKQQRAAIQEQSG